MNNWMAYIAKEKCGCVTGAVVDDKTHPKEVAKDVAGFIKDGRSIERVDGDTVKILLAQCPFDESKHYNHKTCKDCEKNKQASTNKDNYLS